MPVIMSLSKKPVKNKQLKAALAKEFSFLKNIFSNVSIPLRTKGDNEDADFEMGDSSSEQNLDKELPKRARSITELEEKLEKIKSQNNFNLKNKLAKKSLSSKLNKKIKKRERLNKTKVKLPGDKPIKQRNEKNDKPNANIAKPVFNNDGKLVFSKFDFANIGHKTKINKGEKNPRKILENLKQQEEKFNQLGESEDKKKVKELKEKIAWKNILQKAEGQKVKDDPNLLKKSIKKMEQKKKQSKKQWENRTKDVEQKKEQRQKKRQENITKKKKEKKSKVIKAAVKRGRVVI